MRRILLLFVVILGLKTYAQKNSIDPRLSLRFSDGQLAEMDDSRIAYWTYYLDHSYTIMDIPSEKAEYLQSLEVISTPSHDFHGFSLILDAYQVEGAYLRFQDEAKMVAIKPMKQLVEEFNNVYQADKK